MLTPEPLTPTEEAILREDNRPCVARAVEEIDRLRAENEALREAGEDIAAWLYEENPNDPGIKHNIDAALRRWREVAG